MQAEQNPMRKNRNFRVGLVLNVLEGLLSGSNFILLYAIMKALRSGSLDMKHIGLLTGGLGVVFVLRLIIYSTGYVKAQIGGAAVSRRLRLFLGDKLRKIPLSHFSGRQTGQYINTLTANVGSYEKILTHKAGDLAKNIALCVMLIGFVARLLPRVGLILLAGAVLLIPAMWFSFRAVRRYGTQKNAISAEAVGSVVEYISGIQTLRSYGMGGIRNKTTVSSLKAFRDISFRYEAKVIPIGVVSSVLTWMTLPLTIWAASGPWLDGTLSHVSYLLLCMLPLFFSKLCGTIFVDLTSYKNLMISKRQILSLMNESEEPGDLSAFTPDTFDISVQSVRFSYVSGERVLNDVSFTIPDGSFTAIVGDSGSGKSTILNLISKYYEPLGGNISIGGKNIEGIRAESVLNLISLVDQEVFLFDDTVRNNIRYARPSTTDAEVESACREANCEGFIRNLPNGYDTRIGENGNFLSGGERQRLSVARAILKNSPILLLDEATANLDVENELAVKRAVPRLLSGHKTIVMVAHSLSVIQGADQILVMGGGTILETGTHEELLQKGGKYAQMWRAEKLPA